MITLELDGTRIRSIADLYAELNRVFMAGEDWQLGESLDALDDLLYGGFGALHGHESAHVVWRDHAASLRALGLEATLAQLRGRLDLPGYDQDLLRRRIAALERTGHPTYGETVLEIVASHPTITLELA